MKCNNCEYEQHTGKFCGKCGAPMTGQSFQSEVAATVNGAEVQSGPTASPDPKVHIEKVKESSHLYWSYFQQFIRNPSHIIEQAELNFTNSLISVGIFLVLFGLTVHQIVNNILTFVFGMLGEGIGGGFFGAEAVPLPSVPVMSILPRSSLIFLVVLALSVGLQLAVMKFFGPEVSVRRLVSINGTLLMPASLFMAASYLLLVIGTGSTGISLFALGLLVSIIAVPTYIVTVFVRQHSQKIDSFYAVAIFLVLLMIGLRIVFGIFLDAQISEVAAQLKEAFSLGLW